MSIWYAILNALGLPMFEMDFMKNALLAVLLMAPLFGLLSTMIVTGRMSFFSDALGHSGFTGIANRIAKQLEEMVGVEARAVVPGHVQRGGSPTLRDRLLASEMGYNAVELLLQGKSNRVVAVQSGSIVDFDIEEALQMKKPFDFDLYKMAHEISI